MRLTIRHTYDFGEAREGVGRDLAAHAEAWDTLRRQPGPFELPGTRREWEQRVLTPELGARAEAVVAVARLLAARRVCSYGVGNAGLEFNLARLEPGLALVCTDFAPKTVARLAELFPEAEIVRHDLRSEEPPDADLHLMHRIDTELDGVEWREAFRRFRRPLLFVPAQLLGWRALAGELARRLRTPRATRAGYLRSRDAVRDLWAGSHEDEPVAVGDLEAFLLTPR